MQQALERAPLGLLATALSLAGLDAPAAADVLVVDPAGGGDFPTIQQAYDASMAGDVLLVRGGTYPALTVERGLAIVADTGTRITWSGPLTVQDIAGPDFVVLSGMDLGAGLELRTSTGAIRVQESTLLGSQPTSGRGVEVRDCHQVVFAHCELRGLAGGTADDGEGEPGGAALVALLSSQVALYDSVLVGGDGGDGGPGGLWVDANGGEGGAGAYLFPDSELYAMRCRFSGGAGGDGFFGGLGGRGGDGVYVEETGGALARFARVWLAGGPGGWNGNGTLQAPDGQPHVGPVELLAVPGRELIAPAVTRAGDTNPWTILGRPGDRVFLPSSLDPAYRFLYAAAGVLTFEFPLFDPLVQVGTIGPSGTLVLQISAAPLGPGQEARVLFHQLFVISAQGQRVLGGALAGVTLDPMF